jgi:hypothetical protein
MRMKDQRTAAQLKAAIIEVNSVIKREYELAQGELRRLQAQREMLDQHLIWAEARERLQDLKNVVRVDMIKALLDGRERIASVSTDKVFDYAGTMGWSGEINGIRLVLPFLGMTGIAAVLYSSVSSIARDNLIDAIRVSYEHMIENHLGKDSEYTREEALDMLANPDVWEIRRKGNGLRDLLTFSITAEEQEHDDDQGDSRVGDVQSGRLGEADDADASGPHGDAGPHTADVRTVAGQDSEASGQPARERATND